ncbi:MAG TPA: hypothetical protein VGL56_04400 [Fimbriimonadaceae bacterium]|jgi:hypothetical protein
MEIVTLTKLKSPHARAFAWEILDINLLARVIAETALGQVHHAMSILNDEEIPTDESDPRNYEAAMLAEAKAKIHYGVPL